MSTNQHPGEEKNESRLKAATFAEGVAVLLLAILVLVVGINVFLRYVLNIGVEWGDEVARIVFIWIVFIGAYLAFKRNSHAVVTFLGNRVPQKWKKVSFFTNRIVRGCIYISYYVVWSCSSVRHG